eukprot:IDg11556t1
MMVTKHKARARGSLVCATSWMGFLMCCTAMSTGIWMMQLIRKADFQISKDVKAIIEHFLSSNRASELRKC